MKNYYNEILKSKSEDYEYAMNLMKKEASIESLKKINAIQKEKNKQKNIFFLILASILFLTFVLLIRSVFQNRKIRSLNNTLQIQKHLVDEKNHEITKSINYASRIQTALLKQHENVKNFLFPVEYLVFYKPRDIVSGDFYWFYTHADGHAYAGVFDCTGHGVPGAFVSILNMNLLHESIVTRQILYPDEILNYVREKISQLLNLDEHQKDGMDGTLFLFPPDFQTNRTCFYAAAHNPAYLVSRNTISTTSYDKMPVGKFHHTAPFTRYCLTLSSGDILYLSSDGFKDQFGGNHNKRMGSKAFRNLLLSASSLPIQNQHEFLEKYFHQWKKSNEQTDDICLVGIKFI